MSNTHLLTDWVEFNGRSSKDLGLTLNLDGFEWVHPQKQIDYVSIPGTSNEIAHIEDKYAPVTQTFNLVIERMQKDILKKSSDVVAWVSEVDDYKKLRTNLYPDYFFWALPYNVDSLKRHMSIIGDFALTFHLKPYAFVEGSDQYLQVGGGAQLLNSENYDALPRFHLSGSGDCSININGTSYNLTGVSGDLYIDSTARKVWDSSGNLATTNIQFEHYPYLPKNSTISISAGGGISSLEVMPLWRRIF
ncbi:hypothetical protein [Xylocopilactobacillus apis]|uniref:Phage tail protein n=1 Tax=Xylocopilactobacillus apis TaxID=2932183 RepID=A0AAU9DPC6_9LACO|nr:hypothetical protein [Xylocopilactobacillus apis]BDR56873.1 hypothetical protein KIMC2_14350 [Xylocopilactobacillus apis]